jgi:hypothetical protein
MHAIRNAFDNVRFGSNQNGTYFATLDDAPHFCNSGFFLCMGEVAYLGMQGKARQGKARQGKARQGKARQGKARQGKARQGARRL